MRIHEITFEVLWNLNKYYILSEIKTKVYYEMLTFSQAVYKRILKESIKFISLLKKEED